MNLMAEVVTAACVLHNVIIEHEGQASNSAADDDNDDAALETFDVGISSTTGVVRREELLHMLT